MEPTGKAGVGSGRVEIDNRAERKKQGWNFDRALRVTRFSMHMSSIIWVNKRMHAHEFARLSLS
jgi:hypothetical protein